MLTLRVAKNIPLKTDTAYKPVYASCQFVDGSTFRSLELPQGSECRFNARHVYLIGRTDVALMREYLASQLVHVNLHDCDKRSPADSTVTFAKGQACISLKDFLQSNVREVKMRAEVCPVKREYVDTTRNLDLNASARKPEHKDQISSPYMDHGTYFVVHAELTRPIQHMGEPSDEELAGGRSKWFDRTSPQRASLRRLQSSVLHDSSVQSPS